MKSKGLSRGFLLAGMCSLAIVVVSLFGCGGGSSTTSTSQTPTLIWDQGKWDQANWG